MKNSNASVSDGFTLVELLIALALISSTFLVLMGLQAEALKRTMDYSFQRQLHKLAREKLDQVTYGIETERSGTIMLPPEAQWEVTIEDVSTTAAIFLEYRIRLTYTRDADKEESFELMTWVLPDENDPVLQEVELLDDSDEN